MDIYSILIVVTMVIAIAAREFFINKQIKKYRLTISTLLYIISEDPEMYGKVMDEINNTERTEELT